MAIGFCKYCRRIKNLSGDYCDQCHDKAGKPISKPTKPARRITLKDLEDSPD